MFRGREERFAPEATEFWQSNRIPRSALLEKARHLQWLHGDSEENYRLRGNKDLTPESVSYDFNSFGYRSDEFELDRKACALVFLGCSNTLGVGIPFESLWTTLVTNHLENRWQRPVRQYNLAWSGTGSDYIAMMAHQCIELLRPNAVFVLWSYVNRLMWFSESNRQHYFLPEHTSTLLGDEHAAFLRLATEAQGFFNFVRNFHFVNDRLRRLDIPYYWGTIENFSNCMLGHYLPLDGFVGRWNRQDFARDGRHEGVKTHADFAAKVAGKTDKDRLISRGVE